MNRTAAPIDAMVMEVVRGKLAEPDLLTHPDDERSQELATEITRLRSRLRRIENDYDTDNIDGRRFKVAAEKVLAQLKTTENARAKLLAPSGTASMITALDPVAAFNNAPLGVQRAAIAFLIDVKLAHVSPGHHFDPDSVDITPAQ